MGISLYLPTSGLLPVVYPYVLWDWCYSYRASEFHQLLSFSVVWLLDSSHYLGLQADNCIIKYLEDGLHVADFPPWDQKGKGVVWRERRNAAVWWALGGALVLSGCCVRLSTQGWKRSVCVRWGVQHNNILSQIWDLCSSPVLKWHESAIVTVQGCWTFLLDWGGLWLLALKKDHAFFKCMLGLWTNG